MTGILSALLDALKSLFQPRMLLLILWPMLLSAALWTTLAIVFWADWVASLAALVQTAPLQQWVAAGVLAVISHYLISLLLLALLLPLIYLSALALTALFVMPQMVNLVAAARYPGLQRKQGGSAAGSFYNALVALAVYCGGWLLALPLWLFSPFAVVLPLLLAAYLNQRLFRFDALAEHASPEEFRHIVAASSGKLYLLGALTGAMQFVPLLNLIAPTYAGLVFTHFCLSELEKLRQLDSMRDDKPRNSD